ncbi:biotin--protein ligase 2-like [Zingiber officinale]|uniref:biotin--protein ligase 2-like n=1 Tax=Zingiber officinale TaxID=94328 RepID=UPI001C4DC2BD|nr:biotin--protein ligase 2-like [Zingiber officinale]
MCYALVRPAATLLRLRPKQLHRRRLPVSAFSLTSFSSFCGSPMDDRSPATILVLSGKSPREDAVALSLKSRSDTVKLIDEEGAETRVLLGSEADDATFDPRSYMDALSASRFGRFLIWSPKIPSTHDVVSKNFAELPLGTVCVTDLQYKGRGRVKNVWESPIGCLLFSFTLQMEDGRKLPLLQYVVSLAVTEAIKTLCQKKGLPNLDVRIKWPNDLYLNGLKLGGILCTSTYRSKNFNVCAGIGLNLDNEKPTTCLNAALREINPSSVRLSREEVLASFFNKFETFLEIFLTEGFQPLEELYYKTWLHSGQEVVIEEKQEGQPDEKIIVTVQGLTSDGYLLAIDEDDKSYALHPDGNSFDFFKGLVRRKLG